MKTVKKHFVKFISPDGLIKIIVLMLLLFSVSLAQAQTTQIEGTVKDDQGAVIPGAAIKITNLATNQTRDVVTDENGRFKVSGIEPGNYTVELLAAKFKKTTRTIQVLLFETETVDFNLETGVATVRIETVEEQPSGLGQLPNFYNDLTPIEQVTVGAIPSGVNQLGRVIVDGKGKDASTVRLDGIDVTPQIDLPSADQTLDVNDSFTQKPSVAYDPDNPNNTSASRAFAPQFGPGTGSVSNTFTYGGVDVVSSVPYQQWHSQFNVEHLNSALNARNYFDYLGKNDVQRTRFGAKTGGSVYRDKAAIYLAYEGVRGRTERTIFEAVPVEAVCRCGVTGVVGSLLGNYLPNGTVLLPDRSLNSGFSVAQRRGRTSVEANSLNIRFDQTISPTKNLTLRYMPQWTTNYVPDGITGRRQKQQIDFQFFLASFDFLAGGNLGKSNLRFGFNQTKARVESENPAALSPELAQAVINLSGNVTTTGLGNVATVPVATIGSLIKGTGRGYDLDPKTYSIAFDTQYRLTSDEKHQLFFGAEARLIRLSFDRLGGIGYGFSNLSAFRSSLPTSTNFLSDLSGASPFSDQTGKREVRQNYILSYVQFVSKIFSKSLTLTYGLRYDYFGGVNERNNRVFVIDPESGAALSPDSVFFDVEKYNFQPRFALAYKIPPLFEKNKQSTRLTKLFENTVLKFGVGIYSGTPRIGDLILPVESDRLNTTITGGNFNTGINQVLLNFRNQPLTRQFQPLAFSRNFKLPEKLYKWEASFTRTFKTIYDLVLIYTGNTGRNLPIARVGNQITGVSTNPDPAQAAQIVREFDIVSNGQILKPYGEFFYRTNEGRSNYNAFTVQFRRNNVKDISNLPDYLEFATLDIKYTYGMNKANTSGVILSNPFDIGADYGFNASDIRHSFSFSGVYKLWEAFKSGGQSGWLGWQFVPLLTVKSGAPLIVRIDRPDVVYRDGAGNVFSTPAVGRTAAINVPGGGASPGTQVPDLIPNVNPYSSNDRLLILNPQAFAIPQPGTFGNMRRGALRGPNYISLDLGVSRYLLNKDKFGIELRADIFNVFNRANFFNPIISLPNALGTSPENNQLQPGSPYSRLSAGSFGIISSADLGRRIQFSAIFRLKKGFSN